MTTQQYGYTGYYKPPPVKKTSSIAQAASGRPAASDPFGLLTDTTDSARVARINATPMVAAHTVVPASTAAGAGSAVPFHETPQIQTPNTAPSAPAAYDIHTDPALQETDALTGKTEADARAAALAQKQAQLLNYGDADLARKLLGDNTIAAAAAANPNSTVAQLSSQRDTKLHDLTEQLNQANLLYGGYRITQEDQAAKDYQNAIAQAASGVNANIGSIDAQLAQALAAGDQTHIQALLDAYNRHKDDPAATDAAGAGAADGTSPDGQPPADPYGGTGLAGAAMPAMFLDPNAPNVDRLALAARGRVPGRSVGY